MKALAGTWGAVLLPLNTDGSIDLGSLEAELDALFHAGLAGVYTCGTAGEFHALEETEFDALSELVAEKSQAAGVLFQLGASHSSGQACLSRARRARAFGPAAIQVILPDWLPLNPTEVCSAVGRMVEESAPVPLVLYNPPHAKTVCSAVQLAGLAAQFPGLVGVKVAASRSFYEELRLAAPKLCVFGPGHQLAHLRELGVVGSYSNVACLSPTGAMAWERLMDHDPPSAIALGDRVMAFFDTYIAPLKAQGFSNTALDKTLATAGGWAPVGTRVRWPYASVPEELARAISPLARAALPELF